MGKKRQRQEEEDAAADVKEAAAADTETTPHGDNSDGGGQSRGRRSRSLVNPETASYLEDVVTHFKTLVDDEERGLLVGNVLEEIAGKEVKVAGDPICSRHVETLMAAAQAQHLLKFLTSVSDVDGFFMLVSSPFGSHVVEKLFVRLEAQLDIMSEEEYEEFQKVMAQLTDTICPHLYDYVTDRFATHVVRRLLCLLAGRNVLPPAGKQQQQQQLPGLENKRSKSNDQAPVHGLAAKLGPGGGASAGGGGDKRSAAAAMAAELLGCADEPPPCRLPDLVTKFTSVVCSDDYVGALVSELVYHPYACPFLQALLRAAASDRNALRQLVPVLLGASSFNDSSRGGAGAVLEGCKEEEVAAMLSDPTTSHLVEVLLQVLPRPLLEELFKRFLSSRLADMAHHPSANFVVQAALAAAPSKEMAKAMYESLGPLLPDLLRKRRSGVVAALVAACGRHGVCQKEVCESLARALRGLPQWATLKGEHAALAPALLCLDSVPVVGSNEPFSAAVVAAARGGGGSSLPRLSPVGCSILIQVLRYGQGACRDFTDSVAGLQPNDAARVGADPSGSRVLEALLEGNAPAKVKGVLLAALAGHWDAVASTASGSFLVETAYRWADLPVKEAIAARLSAASRELEGTHWGPALLRKVGAESYARDPEQWRRHAASASKTLDQFAKLFGSDFGGGAGEGKGKAKGKARDADRGKKQKRAAEGGAEEEEELGKVGQPEAKEKGKKGKKKARVEKDEEEEDAGGNEQEAREDEDEQDGDEAAARQEDADDAGKAQKKEKKNKEDKKKKKKKKQALDEGGAAGEEGQRDAEGVGAVSNGQGAGGPRVKKAKAERKERKERKAAG